MTAPRNPNKPLTRPGRRILLHLSKGGSLVRLRCRKRGYPKHIDPNKARFYWILQPSPEVIGWHGKEPRPRAVHKSTVEELEANGYLVVRPAAEEIEKQDVTDRGLDILEACDAQGYWLNAQPTLLSNLLESIAPKKGKGA